MLIGAIGAGGTGKTTTMKMVAEKMGLPFRASSSRAIFASHGIVERDQLKMTPQRQYELQLEIFDARIQFERTFTTGVCDRTLLDQLCYNLLRAHGVIHREDHGRLMMQAMDSLKRYDLICYFPLHTFPAPPDMMRDDVWGSRYVFDSILRCLMQDNSVRHLFIPVHTVEMRALMIQIAAESGK